MEEPSTVIKKNAIKSYTIDHSEREKDKKPGGNKPGIKNKHPQAQFFGHENDRLVEYFSHLSELFSEIFFHRFHVNG